MISRLLSVILFVVLMVSMAGNAQATSLFSVDPEALVYVKLDSSSALSSFASTQLPVYTRLGGGVLTGAHSSGLHALREAGLSYQVLDPILRPGLYFLAATHSSRPTPDYALFGRVLLETENGVLLRMDPSQVGLLAQAGVELRAITLTPKPLPAAQGKQVFPDQIIPDPIVQGMIDQVTQEQVYQYDRELAGELPVWVDDDWYTITSRYTYSNTPIQKTMNYVFQHMQALGLQTQKHQWGGLTYPNVIGEITGSTNPDDIFIIGAHIDDVQGTPGADDNASGSVATIIAADILSQYQWGCTLRFALWTGEEQGLNGSYAYAQRSYNMGENIVGYLNLDMIAWNAIGSDPYINLYYSSSIPESQQLANLFDDVIDGYNIDLLTRFGQDAWGSDHYSFWDFGYSSILAIEDDLGNDFNPYYHGSGDTPAHTDPTYFTNFVKASVGTFAHMSDCLIPTGTLGGRVTAADSGLPLEGATVTADDGMGNSYTYSTDATGNYTMTLPADTYTVTATLDGYDPLSQSTTVTAWQSTSLDFALELECLPVTGLDFTWYPFEPYNGDVITFTATVSGTEPFDFEWSFGDTFTATGVTVTHSYDQANTYHVGVSAANTCGISQVSKDVTVLQWIWNMFLPLLHR